MAGPLDLFSILNWSIDLSETIPDTPPNASISRTIWPFATPPMAGLQDICAMVFIFMVHNNTFEPIWAAACAASHPACPAPTTITSYFGNIFNWMFHVDHRIMIKTYFLLCSTWNTTASL